MRHYLFSFSTRQSEFAEKRLIAYVNPEQPEPQTEVDAKKTEMGEKQDPVSLETPTDALDLANKREQEATTEADRRTGALDAINKDIRANDPQSVDAPVSAESPEMIPETFASKLDQTTEANRALYFDLQKDPTEQNFQKWNIAVDAEVSLINQYNSLWNTPEQAALKSTVEQRLKDIQLAKSISLETHQNAKKGTDKVDSDRKKMSARDKREQDAEMISGQFGVDLLPFSKKTDDAYVKFRNFPSQQTQDALVAAGKEEQDFILANETEWRDGQDSLKERHAMGRLASINQIQDMSWERRVKKLEWQESQRQETEKAHEQYEGELRNLLTRAEQSGYPLDSKVTDFVNGALEKMNRTRDAWREANKKGGKDYDMQALDLKIAQAALDAEKSFISNRYLSWNNSIIEQVMRNRFTQLGGGNVLNRDYSHDVAMTRGVSEGLQVESDLIREWLKFKDPNSRLLKELNEGKRKQINYSDLNDFDRDQYMSWKAYGRGKITQDKFDDQYFATSRQIDHTPQRLRDAMYPVVNGAVESAIRLSFSSEAWLQTTDAQVNMVMEGWQQVDTNITRQTQEPIWQFHFRELYLKELNRRMPNKIAAVQTSWSPELYSFTLRDAQGNFSKYVIENGTARNVNKNQQVPSQNPQEVPEADLFTQKTDRPLNIPKANIDNPVILARPRNAVLDNDRGVIPTRNKSVRKPEDILQAPTDDGRGWDELTPEEQEDRITTVEEMFGAVVHEDGTADIPKDQKEVQKNQREASTRKAQEEYDKTSDEKKSKKEADLMMQYGASIDENGKVTIPESNLEQFMNKLGGIGIKVAEFFGMLGEMWDKAFNKNGNASKKNAPNAGPQSQPAPEVKLDKAAFESEVALLKKTSEDAKKGDKETYRLALDEEKRILSSKDYETYLTEAHKNRIKEIDREVKTLDAVKNGAEVRSKVEAILKDKPARTWNKDPNSDFQYKKLGKDSFIRKANDGVMFFLNWDGRWIQSTLAANIQNRDEGIKYNEMLDRVGTNGSDFVQIPHGVPNYEYGHLTDRPFEMIARTRDATGKVTIQKYEPQFGGQWVKF